MGACYCGCQHSIPKDTVKILITSISCYYVQLMGSTMQHVVGLIVMDSSVLDAKKAITHLSIHVMFGV